MPRPVPEEEAPAVVKRENADIITQKREYQVITPLFGGGVEPMTADPVTVIRGSTIRGQLRFWWRATRGGQFGGDLAKMKAAEDAIFGAAATFGEGGKVEKGPSKLSLEIHITTKGSQLPYPKDNKGQEVGYDHSSSPYSYAAFPLSEQQPKAPLLYGHKFVVKISFESSVRDEMEAALWAWETFGGIGGRTRRGFGALKLLSIDDDSVRQKFNDLIGRLRLHVSDGKWPDNVPHLTREIGLDWIYYSKSHQVPNSEKEPEVILRAWTELLGRLRSFRQQRPSGKVPGRSRWPEADTIRHLTGESMPAHSKPISTVKKFPRGNFGLPIIFQFKDLGDPGVKAHPKKKARFNLSGMIRNGSTMSPVDRLASPLILRTAAYKEGIVSYAVILRGSSLPDIVTLSEQGDDSSKRHWEVSAELSTEEAQSFRTGDNQSLLLGTESNVLTAFLNYLNNRVPKLS